MTDASAVPGIVTCWRTIDATLAAVMRVGAVETLDRPTSQPKRTQSWPLAVTLSGSWCTGWTELEPHDDSAAKPTRAAAMQHKRCMSTQGFESSGAARASGDSDE